MAETSWFTHAKAVALRPYALIGLTLIASVCIAFRQEILNGFSFLPGDRYDATIAAAALEHWYSTFRGLANWRDTYYFYPYKNTIANSDAYFLVGVLYSPFRALGADPYLAASLAGVALKCVGFASMVLFVRKTLKASLAMACFAASLFTLNNAMTLHSQRLQLATVALAPLLAYLLCEAYRAVVAHAPRRFLVTGTLGGILYGAWCMTCISMAWFFWFYAMAVAIAFIILKRFAPLCAFGRGLVKMWPRALVVLLMWAAAMYPVVAIFLPKASEVGIRDYWHSQGHIVKIADLLQVGTENLIAGTAYNAFLHRISPTYQILGEYSSIGFTLPLAIGFIAATITAVRRYWRSKENGALLAAALAVVFTGLMPLDFGGRSPWYFVYSYVPGAKAFSVISAYYIFLAFPIVAVTATFIDSLRLRAAVVVPLCLGFLAFELNTTWCELDRHREMARYKNLRPPPQGMCSSFFVNAHSDPTAYISDATIRRLPAQLYAHNVTAMMVAELVHVPTINGFSSYLPRDWRVYAPAAPDYLSRVLGYARDHGIQNLCLYDVNANTWRPVT